MNAIKHRTKSDAVWMMLNTALYLRREKDDVDALASVINDLKTMAVDKGIDFNEAMKRTWILENAATHHRP